MRHTTEESGSTFTTTVLILGVVGFISVYGVYFCQKLLNEARAEEIVTNVFELAKQEKERIDAKDPMVEEDTTIVKNYRREGKRYGFKVKEGATSTLIKIETDKKSISRGVCRALQKKFSEDLWWGVFKKVLIVDRMGDEKTDVLIYDCPHASIRALRFYMEFPGNVEPEVEITTKEPTLPEVAPASLPAPTPTPSPVQRVTPPSSSYTKASCPSGTSSNGLGGMAVAGCHCNNSGEFWNGRSCEVKTCPEGSSRDSSNKGNRTNVSGCRCKDETPIWFGGHCVKKCTGDRVLSTDGRECVCPNSTIPKKGSTDVCVECNETSDCFLGYECINNKCIGDEEDYNDCRWGICQTCDRNNVRKNIIEPHACEVGGLPGLCNSNGTCYPTKGRHCSSMKGCPAGYFCNYGGKFNSNKKQKGKFGQTPNVCQTVEPQEFTYKDKTYYYNSVKDLKSWCRAANNKPNCMWGYLAKSGAESWCASLGKRLLTKAEMSEVWDVLKKELPQTYTGYAYWVQEGAWIVDKKGRRSFGKGRLDGYGGKGGVVCK